MAALIYFSFFLDLYGAILDLLLAIFLGAILATTFFAGAFLATTFFAGAFLATIFFAGAFLVDTFFAATVFDFAIY
jgi:hypothetical protein